VSALEKRLGTRLIDRSQRPLELTPAGQVYYEGCRDVLEQYRSLEDRVRRMQDMVVGTVRVAAIYSVGLMQMESFVEKFEERYPDAHLRIDYAHPDEVYARLRNDEADLGLVSFPKNGGEFHALGWQQQPIVAVVPPNHRLATYGRVTLADLSGEDYVAFTDELTIRREVDRWLKRAKVSVNVVHAFDNIESIKSAIEDGSGVALLPEPTVWREAAAGTLTALPLSGVQLSRPVGIVHRRNKHLTTPALKLIDLLRDHAGANGVKVHSSASKQ
jgi:DNA-binding transcriptional LysR family regulator